MISEKNEYMKCCFSNKRNYWNIKINKHEIYVKGFEYFAFAIQ